MNVPSTVAWEFLHKYTLTATNKYHKYMNKFYYCESKAYWKRFTDGNCSP